MRTLLHIKQKAMELECKIERTLTMKYLLNSKKKGIALIFLSGCRAQRDNIKYEKDGFPFLQTETSFPSCTNPSTKE